MEVFYIKFIETLVIIIAYILLRTTIIKLINKTMSNRLIQKSRGKLIKKAINVTLITIGIIFILIIWGVKQSDIAAYIGSILAVVGIAFFAQWSILSNVTSSIIIFFYHSVKIEDEITIMEAKDYEIEGRVSDVGLFFVTLKTKDKQEITLPNNIFIQKMIKKR